MFENRLLNVKLGKSLPLVDKNIGASVQANIRPKKVWFLVIGRLQNRCGNAIFSPGPSLFSFFANREIRVVAERSSALDSSSAVIKMWV